MVLMPFSRLLLEKCNVIPLRILMAPVEASCTFLFIPGVGVVALTWS
jgi:hypothetical protein